MRQRHLVPPGLLDVGVANEIVQHVGWDGGSLQYFGEQIYLLRRAISGQEGTRHYTITWRAAGNRQ